ncbi:MAG: GxxExxY protein [Patescibacteria group bacterium]|nr:GxxExxY protein [Patescibacteria group bacterium]
MSELIYKELSYKLVGFVYQIENELGYGHNEKLYGDALEELLKEKKINFQREVYCPIYFKDKLIGKRYIDFVIDNKVIIELKTGTFQFKKVFSQIVQYLKIKDVQLGIIFRFTKEGVQTRRVLNIIRN